MKTLSVLLLGLAACASTAAQGPAPAPQAEKPAAAPEAAAPAGAPSEAELGALYQRIFHLMQNKQFDEALRQAADAWNRGAHVGDLAYTAACAASHAGKIDEALTWLQRDADLGELNMGWMKQDSDLEAVRADPRFAAFAERMKAAQLKHLAEVNVGGGLEPSTPEAEGIDAAALKSLLERAEATHSSALVVLRHGKLVGQWYFGDVSFPTETMSATKSITNLAIGLLVDEGKIRSIDDPVATYFPEWKDGVHDKITIRELLNHTSGLHADRTTQKIYASKDFVRFALDSGVDVTPGSEFFYNNSAANLLSGIVKQASGKPMDEYLHEKLFTPLGIREVIWSHDRAGNAHGMSGLHIHAADFAKIGQLMLQKGMWNGKRILSESWIAESTTKPSQPFTPTCGLLWWLEASNMKMVIDAPFLEALKVRGADAAFVTKLSTLKDRPMTWLEFKENLLRELGPDALAEWTAQVGQRRLNPLTVVKGGYDGFSARGSFGQTLVVFPSRDLVAVRFTQKFDESDPTVGFDDFAKRVRALVPAPKPGASAAR